MRLRELVLIGIIILLVGVIAGLGLGDFFGDDKTTGVGSDVTTSVDTAASGENAESGGAAAAPTSTAPTTTATTPTTTSSTTTTTTTTTPPPFAQEVANLPEQTVLGLPLDSLSTRSNTQWWRSSVRLTATAVGSRGVRSTGRVTSTSARCGGVGFLNFRSQGGVETLVNWSWRPGSAIPTGSLPVDPQPDSWVITLHDGVDVDMSLAQIGAAVGAPAVVNDFGYPAVQQRGGWTYLALESVDEAPFEIMARFLICD